jgi:cell division protein ZapA (FtsZ GTPase activity inhibitor)
MKRPVTVVVRWIALVWLAGMVIAANGPSFSQEPAAGQPAASGKKAGRGSADKKADKPSGRVPAYYAKVQITQEQREKVLSIQKDFAAKIDLLRKQLDALTKERDAKMAAVLTPEQQKQIDEMKAAAKKKTREGEKTAKDKPAAGAAEEKPAAKEKE